MGKAKYDEHSYKKKPSGKNIIAEIMAEIKPFPGRRSNFGFLHALESVSWSPCTTRKIKKSKEIQLKSTL